VSVFLSGQRSTISRSVILAQIIFKKPWGKRKNFAWNTTMCAGQQVFVFTQPSECIFGSQKLKFDKETLSCILVLIRSPFRHTLKTKTMILLLIFAVMAFFDITDGDYNSLRDFLNNGIPREKLAVIHRAFIYSVFSIALEYFIPQLSVFGYQSALVLASIGVFLYFADESVHEDVCEMSLFHQPKMSNFLFFAGYITVPVAAIATFQSIWVGLAVGILCIGIAMYSGLFFGSRTALHFKYPNLYP
jgi:hypothetical protein